MPLPSIIKADSRDSRSRFPSRKIFRALGLDSRFILTPEQHYLIYRN